jgi:hypothetical protein
LIYGYELDPEKVLIQLEGKSYTLSEAFMMGMAEPIHNKKQRKLYGFSTKLKIERIDYESE